MNRISGKHAIAQHLTRKVALHFPQRVGKALKPWRKVIPEKKRVINLKTW